MPQRLPRGVLVAFEGIDGSGKSTQARWLAEVAETLLDLTVVRTKEPTAGPWGQRLRDSQKQGRLSPEAELDLFLRDRRDHVETLIAPALARGELVIVDRYYYSTAAYQGARGVAEPAELIRRNRAFAPKPDLVVLVDIEARLGLTRIHGRGLGQDTFESLENLERCRQIFLGLGEPHILTVDGARSPLAVFGDVLARAARDPLQEHLTAHPALARRLTALAQALVVTDLPAAELTAQARWLTDTLQSLR
jgi:dTMP kinase